MTQITNVGLLGTQTSCVLRRLICPAGCSTSQRLGTARCLLAETRGTEALHLLRLLHSAAAKRDGRKGDGIKMWLGHFFKRAMWVRFFFAQPWVVPTCNVTERISFVNFFAAVFLEGRLRCFCFLAMLRHVSKGMWGCDCCFFEQNLVCHFLENSTTALFSD